MGACFSQDSSADSPEAKRSRGLDKQLRDDEKRMTKEVKLLLLGGVACFIHLDTGYSSIILTISPISAL